MPGFGSMNHPIRHRPVCTRMVDPRMVPYGTLFQSVGAAAANACSDKTVRSIVTPQKLIFLHRDRKIHNKQPEQLAESNPKNVIMNVEFSETNLENVHIYYNTTTNLTVAISGPD